MKTTIAIVDDHELMAVAQKQLSRHQNLGTFYEQQRRVNRGNAARGYLLKGCKPFELKQALYAIVQQGYYYTEFVTGQLIKSLNPETLQNPQQTLHINDREMEFIK